MPVNQGSPCFKGTFIGSRNSVYPAISRNDNHCSKHYRPCAPDASQYKRRSVLWIALAETVVNAGNCARRRRPRRSHAVGGRDVDLRGIGEDSTPGASGTGLGTRASANTSGPDFTLSLEPAGTPEPVKLRIAEIRTERRKTCFFCRTVFRASELFRSYDPAV